MYHCLHLTVITSNTNDIFKISQMDDAPGFKF